jgi:hypothetical protein
VHLVNHRTLWMIVIVVATLMVSTAVAFGYVCAAQPPIAKIVSVDYPRHVLSGREFSVTVVADYSDKVGVDIGIWDAETGAVVQSISIPLRDTGRTTFGFKLTAPTTTDEWHLLAITRIWWQDAWYQDQLEGSEAFTISVSENATVGLMSSGPTSTIGFDGSEYPVNNTSPPVLSMRPGVHQLETLPIIQSKVGERFVFVGWSDGVNSNPRQFVISGDASIVALYRTEYYLSVKSERGQVSGEGWYPGGSRPRFAVVPTSNASSWLGLLTENYKFAGWSGDSNSSNTLASVTMNGPKNVEAKWTRSGITVDPFVIAKALFFGALVLLVRGIHQYSKRRLLGTLPRGLRQFAKLFVVAMTLLMVLSPTCPTYAQLPPQSVRSIVKIGDASWYYWNNTSSDTCLIWLGGGVTQERDIGYYSYRINPFQYESFGTIRFMQDLAKHYCVIALEKGSYESFSLDSNRTIYQEPYKIDSRIIGDVHSWIRRQGYADTFLVGYSTGAQVAAMEVALRAPEEWASPDGLILITPSLSNVVSLSAYRIHASLLVLYGGSIETPAYVSTGREFYDNAPQDSRYGSHYFYKEFRVIEKMGHEVWTIYETGTYDMQAVHILVNFIDNVKSLQFTPSDVAMITHAQENSSAIMSEGLNITSVRAPYETQSARIMRIEVAFTYDLQTSTPTQVIAFNLQSGKIESSAELTLVDRGNRVVNLDVLPSSNSSELSFAIVALRKEEDGWKLAAKPVFTKTKVMQAISVTVASAVPNMSFVFDGVQFRTAENGVLHFETKPGTHIAQVESVSYLNSLTRVVFTGWDDGSTDTTRQVTIANDTSLFAIYRMQHFVNVTSSYGQSEGSGWYDENAMAVISVEPPMMNESAVIFAHWTGDATSSDLRSLLIVNSQKTVRAGWNAISSNGSVQPTTIVWLLVSLVLFAVAFAWNIKALARSSREADYG